MSDTPRTDYYTKRLRNLCDDEFVPIEFARQLERELVAVTEERDELKSKYRTHHDEAERITNEIRRVSSVCRELEREVVNWKMAHDIAIEQRDRAQSKIENQAERIKYLEGATNHATGTPLSKMREQRDRLAEALWSMLNQDDGSAIRAGILLRSLGLQSPTNPNKL